MRSMSSHQADSTQGNHKKQHVCLYFIGAGIGLQCVLRLLDIPPDSLSYAWTAVDIAGPLEQYRTEPVDQKDNQIAIANSDPVSVA